MNDQSPGKNASLRLAEPAELAGEWLISRQGGSDCPVRFDAARVEAANAHAIADSTGCLAALAGAAVAGWRPVPDGIELAGPDRLTVLFFAYADGGRGVARTADGAVTLRRPIGR